MQILRSCEPSFWSKWQELRAAAPPRTGLYTLLDLEYLKHYPEPWEAEDLSWLILDREQPVAGVLMALKRQIAQLSCYGRPILYLESREKQRHHQKWIEQSIREEFGTIGARYSGLSVYYQSPGPVLDAVGDHLLQHGATTTPSFSSVVNLALDEATLHQQLRKSYRSLINWGTKNLDLRIMDARNADELDFGAYHRLHWEAAGRETRSSRTWAINYAMIQQNQAFLVLGRLDGSLVTGGLFNHDGRACYYSNGASNRALFDKPLAHAVIWRALLHAKQIGCEMFEVGQVLFARQPLLCGPASPSATDTHRLPTDKELAISLFKRGFGGTTSLRLDIVGRVGAANPVGATTEAA